jgi:hypothetical protein
MNPEAGYGWEQVGQPLRNAATRKKGQQTWSCYLSLDPKEERLAWGYTEATNSWETCVFLYERLAWHERLGHTTLVLVWDQASWHTSHDLRRWIRGHNRRVQALGRGVKLVPVCLPVHAFWLNPVEAHIGRAKGHVLPCRQFEQPLDQQRALDRHWLHRNLGCASAPSPETLITVLH